MRSPIFHITLALGTLGLAACGEPRVPTSAPDAAALTTDAGDPARAGARSVLALAEGTGVLSTLVFAVGYSDANCGTSFGATLSARRGQYTVFAPTDDAFATAIEALGVPTVLSCDVLPTVLAYHVTRGRHTSTSVLARRSIRMLSGEPAAVGGTTIAGAPLALERIDLPASNGVVHVVDAVLLPPSIVAALQSAPGGGRATTAALRRAPPVVFRS
jgi:hypothetical protein